jgi:hypothetical protein
MTCSNCKQEFGEIAGYHVSRLNIQWDFCGRICLVEGMTPEVNRAIVLKQWVPTEEENERMMQ